MATLVDLDPTDSPSIVVMNFHFFVYGFGSYLPFESVDCECRQYSYMTRICVVADHLAP